MLAQNFVELNAPLAAEARRLVDGSQYDSLRRLAHGLKSGALWLGGFQCAATAIALEAAAAVADGGAPPSVPHLRWLCERLADDLRRLVARLHAMVEASELPGHNRPPLPA